MQSKFPLVSTHIGNIIFYFYLFIIIFFIGKDFIIDQETK